jgi:predicted O-methyltransferase YrrM
VQVAASAIEAGALADAVVVRAGSHEIHRRLLDAWRLIEGDKYLTETMHALELAIEHDRPYWELCCALAAYTDLCAPARYLEIGVRRGRSAVAVSAFNPEVDLYLFDMWHPNYADVANPGPDFVRRQLERVGHRGEVHFFSGRSQETVPAFFADENHRQAWPLITVDGDHRDAGALADLRNVGDHLAPGGMLTFDDIAHPGYPTLHRTWSEFVSALPDLEVRENSRDATGTGIAIRTAVGQ